MNQSSLAERIAKTTLATAQARAIAETAAPANQLTAWEAVTLDNGLIKVKAQFKAPFGRKTWFTLFEQAYATTGAGKDMHNGTENAARIARAMNLAYPVR